MQHGNSKRNDDTTISREMSIIVAIITLQSGED